jgi:hypothetical protein
MNSPGGGPVEDRTGREDQTLMVIDWIKIATDSLDCQVSRPANAANTSFNRTRPVRRSASPCSKSIHP